jgi:hypothetical protein
VVLSGIAYEFGGASGRAGARRHEFRHMNLEALTITSLIYILVSELKCLIVISQGVVIGEISSSYLITTNSPKCV